jgi:hypothetical protein
MRALPVDLPSADARKIYEEPELPHHLMNVLMTLLDEGEALRTTFHVNDLLFVPRTVYRILAKTLSPIERHNSETEEVVGIMKNLLFNIIHGIPIDIHDFFKRTLATVAQSPFEVKPYAPWIMKFIRTRSSINYRADCQNHLCFMPYVEILPSTIASVPGQGKAIIDEGVRSLDGQFC